MVHSLRSLGSAALNFAMVAGGGLDLYWYIFLSFYISRGSNLNWLGRLAVGLGMYARELLLQKKRAVW